MCHPDCNSLSSSRRVWIEIDSQVLDALLCVTGFGLAPWRIRDVYFWFLWRLGRSEQTRHHGLYYLAYTHCQRFLQAPDLGTQLPDQEDRVTGTGRQICATFTSLWKMDFVV
ncbi:hypothetical protein BO70DRAFT_366107 [Aspergillus heteromorphus CBS 117.55]|uniref:Uncharacterized protein n=1 Tax=Aspergillus heteromorphus CBS 117.55 TaxID=1448321 RepID=A0A317V328_9EURO|nr:uncharacterized protein BO70DRAFT_366107 [Aspergillus heteromorphus CBS 117.55]PWY68436.1 hypothetical protein BO70DRAFT_366107 [Aspergillus heteromorphus CBS 117.55]